MKTLFFKIINKTKNYFVLYKIRKQLKKRKFIY